MTQITANVTPRVKCNKRSCDILGERYSVGSLSWATAGSEATLQVLAAAGRVCVRTWRDTPHSGHVLNCTNKGQATHLIIRNPLISKWHVQPTASYVLLWQWRHHTGYCNAYLPCSAAALVTYTRTHSMWVGLVMPHTAIGLLTNHLHLRDMFR